jgi:hypothetical protein
MVEYNFKPLVDGIRACFPTITRDRISISHVATAHNGNIVALRVRVIVDSRFSTFDSDKLMTLLDADEMVGKDSKSTVKGRFDGKPCEIALVIQRAEDSTTPN